MQSDQAGKIGRHEEHIAQTEQLLGSNCINNNSGVNLGRNPEGNPAVKIILNRAGNDIN